MPWVQYDKVAHGVVVAHVTLADRMCVGALTDAGACQDVWPVAPDCVFLVLRSVDVTRPLMQPASVHRPALDGALQPVTPEQGQQLARGCTTHPPQHWPDDAEFDAAAAAVPCNLRPRRAWFRRAYIV